MKRTLLYLSLLTFLFSCLNTTDKEKTGSQGVAGFNDKIDSSSLTQIQWLDSVRSLGTVTEGEILKITYRFKNIGKKPLVIDRVQPGCGCTVADYPKTPIAPQETGEVVASFNSQGKAGVQKKNITVYANTAQQFYTLWFNVIVNKAE
jgi:hypothetical protein